MSLRGWLSTLLDLDINNMNVLSLFDGMSCGQIALKDLGVHVNKYYASEIDKYAIAQTQLNFPETIQLGDVENWREWDVDLSKIDLLIGGSPCQGFSFAGKQLAFDDSRSRLFFVYVDILNHIRESNPNIKFLLENVVMKKEHINVITEMLGVYPVLINSSLVSAQNRKRLYWSNIRTRKEGLFGDVYTDIPQPADIGIVIKDILEEYVEDKFYLKDGSFGQSVFGKCRTLRTGGRSSTTDKHCWDVIKLDKSLRPKGNQDKASCLTAGGHSGGNHSDMDLIHVYQRHRGKNKGGRFVRKAPTLTSCSYEHNNVVVQLNPSRESGSKQPYQGNRIYADYGKSPALMTERRGGIMQYDHIQGASVRRFTPTECARLQTIPEWYKWQCSDSQAYKMLGNGWTVEVIKHIFKFL